MEPRAIAGVKAVVVVPTQRSRAARLVRALRDAYPQTLLLVGYVGGATDADAAHFYRAGAAGVYSWPDEAVALRETLGELLAGAAPATRASSADRTLKREIGVRLRASGEATAKLEIKVRDGVASVAGHADRLWRKQKIDLLISQVPGVRSVMLRNLVVPPSGRSDGEVSRALRALLRGASSIEDRTLAVTVHDGHAIVKGTVINEEEWEHMRDLIALVNGVRSVTDETVAAPRRKRVDRHVARRLQTAFRSLLRDSEEIRPAVVGRIVVLRGLAPSLATKRDAEKIAKRDPSVERVVNKIEVMPRSAGPIEN